MTFDLFRGKISTHIEKVWQVWSKMFRKVTLALTAVVCVSAISEASELDLDELYIQYFAIKHFVDRYETGYRDQLSSVIDSDEDAQLISLASETRAISDTSGDALSQAYSDFCAIADFSRTAQELATELDAITRSFFVTAINQANTIFAEFSPGAQNALRAVLHVDFVLPIKAGKVGPTLNSVDSANADPDGFKAKLQAGCKLFE